MLPEGGHSISFKVLLLASTAFGSSFLPVSTVTQLTVRAMITSDKAHEALLLSAGAKRQDLTTMLHDAAAAGDAQGRVATQRHTSAHACAHL
jgi:hypothetical protein